MTDYFKNDFIRSLNFKISDWQEKAIIAIENNEHVLITAPTGSGKTLPAEFAIYYFNNIKKKKKKIIYTSPIKALSNQKYYEFKNKFPNLQIGLLTGDIKININADILIMTTEILRNNLIKDKINNENKTNFINKLDFEINIENEVGILIFDEVHYINDKNRGGVWEECFMSMPPTVQCLMLSATIDNSEKFANWIENIHKNRKVKICSTVIRSVPLEHYFWYFNSSQQIEKKIKEEKILEFYNKYCNKLVCFKNKTFFDTPYLDIKFLKNQLNKYKLHTSIKYVINQLLFTLKKKQLLPALFFVYSKKNLEYYANSCEMNLFDDDPIKIQLVEKEAEKILRKLPNYKEYIELPEYKKIIKLLQKGIAIHHSGILPVFREMIELLFEKGFIKALFATETFAVGINMPTKTVVFTDVQKYDGNGIRFLESHEYTQQAGRAGRRGFDTKGYVIHLVNNIELPNLNDYKKLTCGNPEYLESRFKISYELLLSQIQTNNNLKNLIDYTENSMMNLDIKNQLQFLESKREKLSKDRNEKEIIVNKLNTPLITIQRWIKINELLEFSKNNSRKKLLKEQSEIHKLFKNIESDVKIYTVYLDSVSCFNKNEDDIYYASEHIKYNIEQIKNILIKNNFIEINKESKLTLKEKGVIGNKIKEIHPLVFSDIIFKTNYFNDLEYFDIASIISCFCKLSVSQENKLELGHFYNKNNYNLLTFIKERLDYYYNCETICEIFTGSDYEYNFDFYLYINNWCRAENESQCKEIINRFCLEKQQFIGDFIKIILKINNIVSELEIIAQHFEKYEFLEKLKLISKNSLKFIATNQSLYI